MFFKRKKEPEKRPAPAQKQKKSPAKGAQQAPAKAADKAPAKAPTVPQLPPAAAEPKLKQSEIRERLQGGWLKIFITFELAGKPREHIEETLRAYIITIKADERIISLNEEYADAIEHDDGMFSAFVEMETLVRDAETLTWIAINFMPASIELLEPAELRLGGATVTNWYNDLLSKLHEVSNVLREERNVNAHLTEALNALIKNAVLLAVKDGPKSGKEIAATTGVQEEQLEPFLTHLVEKGRLAEKGKKYSLP
jgi:hypothetical protein